MQTFLRSLVMLVLFITALAAQATVTTATYNFTNTVLQDSSGKQATVNGSIVFTFDSLNSLGTYVNSVNFAVNANGKNYAFDSSAVLSRPTPPPRANSQLFQFSEVTSPAPNYTFYLFNLYLPIYNNSPVPFDPNGTNLCPIGGICTYFGAVNTSFVDSTNSDTFNNVSGTLQLPTATPEPSTLILLGSSLLAFAGPIRRRFAHA